MLSNLKVWKHIIKWFFIFVFVFFTQNISVIYTDDNDIKNDIQGKTFEELFNDPYFESKLHAWMVELDAKIIEASKTNERLQEEYDLCKKKFEDQKLERKRLLKEQKIRSMYKYVHILNICLIAYFVFFLKKKISFMNKNK